jgi:hypothetical protein
MPWLPNARFTVSWLVPWSAVRRLLLLGVLFTGLQFAGCGGTSRVATGVTVSPHSPAVAESDVPYSNAPPITKALVRE